MPKKSESASLEVKSPVLGLVIERIPISIESLEDVLKLLLIAVFFLVKRLAPVLGLKVHCAKTSIFLLGKSTFTLVVSISIISS